MSEDYLQAFILYCQTLESAAIDYAKSYYEWKKYWLNYYMKGGKDLYNAFDPIELWSKNLNRQKNNFGY